MGSDEETESPNFKELRNLFDTVDQMKNEENGILRVKLFKFTDNSVA